MCYHVKFGYFASETTAKYKGTSKLGSAGHRPITVEAWMTRKKYAPPSRVILPNLIVLVQMVRSLLSRSAWNNLIPHFLPFKVTQGQWNRHWSIRHHMTY